ncbi:MAG: hypothetical protein AAGO57_05665 [Pseudomonadota bacterium]
MAYGSSPRPTAHIAGFAAVLLVLLIGLDQLLATELKAWMLHETLATRTLIFLLLFYVAQWVSYFMSVLYAPFRIQSLRALLAEAADEPDIETIREKGRSVLTTQAIFTAISVFVISALYRSDNLAPDPLTGWDGLSFYLVLTCAVFAVVLLIVSADAVETTFNDFGEDQNHFVQYFYKVSRRRKYYGFVLAVLSVILFVSRISPTIGCLAVLMFLISGYDLWFPRAAEDKPRPNFLGYLLLIVLFLAVGHLYITDGQIPFG